MTGNGGGNSQIKSIQHKINGEFTTQNSNDDVVLTEHSIEQPVSISAVAFYTADWTQCKSFLNNSTI